MSKRLKLSGAAYRRQTESQQRKKFTEICGIHRCICKKGRKITRANDEKGDKQLNKKHHQ